MTCKHAVTFLATGLLLLACSGDKGGTLIVDDGSVARVDVSVPGASLEIGETVQLSAVARTAGGAVAPSQTFSWSTSNASVATVTPQGLVTAVAVGTAEIRAVAQGRTGTSRIDVFVATTAAGTIQVDPAQRFQTMRGWQSGTNWGFEHPLHATVASRVLDLAANELGIDRVRMPLRSGSESNRDWYVEFSTGAISNDTYRCNRYATVNDNADPAVINPSGFHFTEIDDHVENTVLPLRQRLQARGESLWVVLTYVAHTVQNCAGTQFNHTQAEEYAEFLLAAFQHLQQKYALVPDAVELVNEPDYGWTYGSQPLAGMLEAAGARLRAAGFTPVFEGPSTMSAVRAVEYYNAMVSRPGNAQLVSELTYHRYAGGYADLQAIGSKASASAVSAVMGELNGGSVQQLYEDLTIANAAAWEQGTMAWYKHPNWSDDGTAHYWIDFSNAASPTITLGTLSRPLRQYFNYVRRGAVRIGASSQDAALRPVAFINKDGAYVTVIWTTRSGAFTVSGLRAGTYGINFTTATQLNVEASAVTIPVGGTVSVNIPAAGVVTVYRK